MIAPHGVMLISQRSNEHLGVFAHERRNLLASGMLAFDALRSGSVCIRGSTANVLEHSPLGLRDLVDRSLTDLRLSAGLAPAGAHRGGAIPRGYRGLGGAQRT
jgi:hypothetical protein